MYFKSNHLNCSIKKVVPKTFGILTGKQLCWSLVIINFQAFTCTLTILIFFR